jgi:hypothetical protein
MNDLSIRSQRYIWEVFGWMLEVITWRTNFKNHLYFWTIHLIEIYFEM